jgi:hypothetical protein
MKIQRVWSRILLALIILTVTPCNPQKSPDVTVVKTVEAENCNREEDCRLKGFWKPWAMSGFSGGQLINNEASLGKAADSSKLVLTFQGTGVIIVYRQDIWYGSLRVEIDDQVGSINQQGTTVRNQAEACFEVDGEGPHSLILSGSKDTGVITVDAIKVLEGRGYCDDNKGSPNRGMIVPAYFYPDLPNGYWSQLVTAAQNIGEKLIVIANPSDGPGIHQDQNYSNAINTVRHNGGKVIGYVHTCYGNQTQPNPNHPLCPKAEASVKADVDTWYDLYPMIDGIFFDETSSDQEKVSYYQTLYDYIQKKQSGSIVVNNFGVTPDQGYFGVGSSILCVFENEFPSFIGWTSASWITSERSLVLVHNTSNDDLQKALAHLSKEDIGWFYVTSDAMPNPWDTLPHYFSDVVKSVSD